MSGSWARAAAMPRLYRSTWRESLDGSRERDV
jgi:hypothetical protein